MSAPPVPPRPYELASPDSHPNRPNPGLPPPLPPLPPEIRRQAEKLVTPSRYEYEYEMGMDSPPHFENPLIAPRPCRVDKSIPANMARTLDEQAQAQMQVQSGINYNPGFMIMNNAQQQPQQQTAPSNFDLNTSIANLALQSSMPPPPVQYHPPSPPRLPPSSTTLAPPPPPPPTTTTTATAASTSSLPSLTAPLPQLAQLQAAAAQIQLPTHDPALKLAWCRDILFLLDYAQGCPTDPVVAPVSVKDPVLARLAEAAVPMVLQLATSWSPSSQSQPQSQAGKPPKQQMPAHVSESIYHRATLAATGAFPTFVRHSPRTAFRDFEAAARGGYAPAWFRLGRDYENFSDHARARECFERGARAGVGSCVYRMGMAHLLGQLSLPPNPALALPLLHRAATLATLSTPQPAYVYALLLLSEFTLLSSPLPPSLFSSLSTLSSPPTPLIPPNSSPTLEARPHLLRAAHLHFPAAQYKLGHAYEFAEPPFNFDPLMSVQWYSLASERGEVEADMALSKWFLCGSGGAALALSGASGGGPNTGGFEKDESLALIFAEKAAKKGLPSAEFAMGYYAEVGVGQARDVGKAVGWYERAQAHGNPDAPTRLAALLAPSPSLLSRAEHDSLTESKLMRRRTMAARRAEEEPVSPPWEGRVFPSMVEAGGGGGGGYVRPGSVGAQGQQGRGRREDGRTVVDVIRKNSLAYASSSTSAPVQVQGGVMPSIAVGGRMHPSHSQSQSQFPAQSQPQSYSQGQGQNQGYPQMHALREESPARGRYTSSPQQGQQGRMGSPARRTQSPARLPIGGSASQSQSQSGSPGRLGGGGIGTPVQGQGQGGIGPGGGQGGIGPADGRTSKLERMRLNNLNGNGSGSDERPASNPNSNSIPASASASFSNANSGGRYDAQAPISASTSTPAGRPAATHRPSASASVGGEGGKRPQTFAEMGIHGAKAGDKDCVIM